MYKHFFKRFFDFWISLVVLICISPVLLIVTIWLHFANKGAGAFFTQERPGKNAKIFKVIKFKTMTDERDENGELLPDENRLTKVGKFVRSTSIDELPQLINVLKGDINAFEIETVIAPKDYRMLRLDFSCSSKANAIACKKLYDAALEKGITFAAKPLSDVASESAEVQHTVPAFYNVQISENCSSEAIYNPYISFFAKKNGKKPLVNENASPNNMRLEQFRCIVNDISEFSETAIVDLSGFSDPLTHPDFADFVKAVLEKKGLSLLIETDGNLVTLVLAKKISEIAKEAGCRINDMPSVMWIVNVDAVSEQKYAEIHKREGLRSAQEAVKILENFFPGCVYPQMLRMNTNEDELESFYRFYHDKESPSHGNLIIQKYDHYCGLLSEEKPADLSPIKRCPCWHLKRDMFILPDGSVPLCREYILDNVTGNVFADGIENIWKKTVSLVNEHIQGNYSEKCGACDEYYTFNF